MGCLIFFSGMATSYANDDGLITVIEVERKNELWLNAGMHSYHYDKSQSFNNNNVGFGAEYQFSSVASVTVGGFKNSDSSHSNYAGIFWQPLSISLIRVGLAGGGFNGYSSTNNGGWFPAVFPVATIEWRRIGANVFFIPTVGDRVHGAISLQLKLKVLD